MKRPSKKVINVTFIASLLAITMIVHFRAKYIQSLPNVYTIGKMTDIYSSRSSSKRVKYIYMIDGVEYEQVIVDDRRYREFLKKGECFIVSVPLKFKSKGLLLKDYPTNGYCEMGKTWTRIPKRFELMKIQDYQLSRNP